MHLWVRRLIWDAAFKFQFTELFLILIECPKLTNWLTQSAIRFSRAKTFLKTKKCQQWNMTDFFVISFFLHFFTRTHINFKCNKFIIISDYFDFDRLAICLYIYLCLRPCFCGYFKCLWDLVNRVGFYLNSSVY